MTRICWFHQMHLNQEQVGILKVTTSVTLSSYSLFFEVTKCRYMQCLWIYWLLLQTRTIWKWLGLPADKFWFFDIGGHSKQNINHKMYCKETSSKELAICLFRDEGTCLWNEGTWSELESSGAKVVPSWPA